MRSPRSSMSPLALAHLAGDQHHGVLDQQPAVLLELIGEEEDAGTSPSRSSSTKRPMKRPALGPVLILFWRSRVSMPPTVTVAPIALARARPRCGVVRRRRTVSCSCERVAGEVEPERLVLVAAAARAAASSRVADHGGSGLLAGDREQARSVPPRARGGGAAPPRAPRRARSQQRAARERRAGRRRRP